MSTCIFYTQVASQMDVTARPIFCHHLSLSAPLGFIAISCRKLFTCSLQTTMSKLSFLSVKHVTHPLFRIDQRSFRELSATCLRHRSRLANDEEGLVCGRATFCRSGDNTCKLCNTISLISESYLQVIAMMLTSCA